jgi:hypothetical protein
MIWADFERTSRAFCVESIDTVELGVEMGVCVGIAAVDVAGVDAVEIELLLVLPDMLPQSTAIFDDSPPTPPPPWPSLER